MKEQKNLSSQYYNMFELEAPLGKISSRWQEFVKPFQKNRSKLISSDSNPKRFWIHPNLIIFSATVAIGVVDLFWGNRVVWLGLLHSSGLKIHTALATCDWGASGRRGSRLKFNAHAPAVGGQLNGKQEQLSRSKLLLAGKQIVAI